MKPAAAVSRHSSATPPPDVHIHIGRVELTALPVAAPKRDTSSVKKPMSLDEYLKSRSTA